MTVRPAIWIAGAAAALFILTLAACSPIRGYPADPEDTTATLDALKPYFGVDQDKQYNSLAIGSPARLALRNEIVLGRMRAFNLEFDDFERRLNGDANGTTAGGDLVLLILGGLGATTGASATKAALAAPPRPASSAPRPLSTRICTIKRPCRRCSRKWRRTGRRRSWRS